MGRNETIVSRALQRHRLSFRCYLTPKRVGLWCLRKSLQASAAGITQKIASASRSRKILAWSKRSQIVWIDDGPVDPGKGIVVDTLASVGKESV